MDSRTRAARAVLALVACAAPASAQPTALVAQGGAAPAPTYADVVYATVGGTPLRLDLYVPSSGPAPYPLVVWIHSGSWTAGSKAPLPPFLEPLLAQGIALAGIDFRQLGEAGLYGTEPVVFPAPIHDVKGALRWLRAHAAQLALDPARFAAVGVSSGGHLAALAALSAGAPELEGSVGGNLAWSSDVRAFVDFFGPTDLLHMAEDVATPPGSDVDHDAPTSPESNLLGWGGPGQGVGDIKANLANPASPYPELVALAALASPLQWVGAGDAPGFLVHGLADKSVPSAQSAKLAAALASAGVPHVHVELAGLGHENPGSATEAAVRAFLVGQLLPQDSVYVPALSTLQPTPSIGAAWSFDLVAAPGSTLWRVYVGAPSAAPLALGPLGVLLLDPAQALAPLAQGALVPPQSAAHVSLMLPPDPVLHGSVHALQALVVVGAEVRVSNLLTVFVQ